MADEWPASWFVPGMRQLVLDFLVNLEIPGIHRKYAFMYWCERVGTVITAEEVELLTGQPAGEL